MPPRSPTREGVAAGEAPTAGFRYVYILTSQSDSTRHYIGQTEDLNKRLQAHNAGQVKHTAKDRPWQIETALAFRSPEKAVAFERYLKTHSGRAFAKKRL